VTSFGCIAVETLSSTTAKYGKKLNLTFCVQWYTLMLVVAVVIVVVVLNLFVLLPEL
jgi:hypothetical protein